MRPIVAKLVFVLMAIFVIGKTWGEEKISFDRYEVCLSELHKTVHLYEKLVPPPLLAVDKKLRAMKAGVTFVEENLLALKAEARLGSYQGIDSHIVWNATKSCEDYLATFKLRLRWLILYLGALALTLIFLVLRLAIDRRP